MGLVSKTLRKATTRRTSSWRINSRSYTDRMGHYTTRVPVTRLVLETAQIESQTRPVQETVRAVYLEAELR